MLDVLIELGISIEDPQYDFDRSRVRFRSIPIHVRGESSNSLLTMPDYHLMLCIWQCLRPAPRLCTSSNNDIGVKTSGRSSFDQYMEAWSTFHRSGPRDESL